jgi:hypothetical protein
VKLTWNDEGVIQRNQSALTLRTSTQDRGVGASNKLSPKTMDNFRPSLNQWICDIHQEWGIRIEVRYRKRLELKTFSSEILFYKVNDFTVGSTIRNVLESG